MTDAASPAGDPAGHPGAARKLVPLVYDELRERAARYLRGERPGHTLSPTALVHEAYQRLTGGGLSSSVGPTEFAAIAAVVMRRVLVDHARAKQAGKRGAGRSPVRLTAIPDLPAPEKAGGPDALVLDEALERLAKLNERHARIVELRFFGGLTVPEIATTMGLSISTVEDDWRMARAWLAQELRPDE